MAGAFDLDDLDDELDELDKSEAPAAIVQASSDRVAQVGSCSAVKYFAEAAPRNMWWYHAGRNAWLRRSVGGSTWSGWSVDNAERVEDVGEWTPWDKVLDESDPPFYRWYSGSQTNAAFTEVDAHVLGGQGDQLAYIEEPDPLIQGDKPEQITRGALLARSAAAAHLLQSDYGLQTGDRVLFFLPAGVDQIVWVEACKRLGVVYCCCNPLLPAEQLADRVAVLQAKLVITVEHADWSYPVHKALNEYVRVEEAISMCASSLGLDRSELERQWAMRVTVSRKEPPFNKVPGSGAKDAPVLQGAKVLILGHIQLPVYDVHKVKVKPDMKAETRVLDSLTMEIEEPRTPADVATVWARSGGPPRAVEANFPLFIIFTSGTTGKPKGVCHAHGYVAGLVETMQVVFKADPQTDKMLTVGALGWITGQSYQIAAVLGSGVTAVLMRGNPVQPSRTRFAEVIQKHGVTIFKAGSAFLREVMTTSEAMAEVRGMSLPSLKIATFCAEPVSEAVQQFAQQAVCPMYINSYWATEHGGIAWSRRFGEKTQPLKADAHSWPLPWVDADVYCYDEASKPSAEGGLWKARRADSKEKGDVVCTAPYPYMFRFVWGDVDNFGQPGWAGDRKAMLMKYWRRTQLPEGEEHWCYTQGDFAVRYEDSAFTFHGRSDEVLNVNGILFGTEHIEGAVLRDKQLNKDSPVGHCVVVGYPDEVSGEVPLAFLTAANTDNPPNSRDFLRLFRLVEDTVGQVNVKFIVVPALPQTFSGKFMRRVLTSISRNQPLGDLSTISNPECIQKITEEFAKWKKYN